MIEAFAHIVKPIDGHIDPIKAVPVPSVAPVPSAAPVPLVAPVPSAAPGPPAAPVPATGFIELIAAQMIQQIQQMQMQQMQSIMQTWTHGAAPALPSTMPPTTAAASAPRTSIAHPVPSKSSKLVLKKIHTALEIITDGVDSEFYAD
ncbi:hypothetical protein BDP27DRAFT_1361882 [Rhodocollybia butyracea]|uniref:Uncharacterized protein n=1 Tax=Rhodocollybia butyracea TaxID=206335 RepID=A0A9P5U9S8_9AGAR|nr:hypothetical protein BDP27DRAFT_1361882 [Rhodocollybia butyracea]